MMTARDLNFAGLFVNIRSLSGFAKWSFFESTNRLEGDWMMTARDLNFDLRLKEREATNQTSTNQTSLGNE